MNAMFFHTKSTKELMITLGTICALTMFFVLAISVYFNVDGWAEILCILIGIIPIMVIIGFDMGYAIARFFIGVFAVIIVGGALNPFTYGDFYVAHKLSSYSIFLVMAVFLELFVLTVFYCLGEHQRIRKQKVDVV